MTSRWDQKKESSDSDDDGGSVKTESSTKRPLTVSMPPPKKRLIPENASSLAGMTKAELQAALLLPDQSFKELREIAKKLEQYPPVNREANVDAFVETSDLVMKKYNSPQVFTCFRCDHTKISDIKAKWRGDKFICHSCHDHLTRCVIPYKDLPDHQKPKRCIHKVPKSYQKEFR